MNFAADATLRGNVRRGARCIEPKLSRLRISDRRFAGRTARAGDVPRLRRKISGRLSRLRGLEKAGAKFREPRTDHRRRDRVAQGKLQLRGRLNEAFKDEETNLVRQLEGRK